jgi:hypothetical protein
LAVSKVAKKGERYLCTYQTRGTRDGARCWWWWASGVVATALSLVRRRV